MLQLQYFRHLMLRADVLEKTLMLGRIEGRRRRGGQEEKGMTEDEMRWLDGITNSTDMSRITPGDGEGRGGLVCCSPWGHKESDMTE